MEKYAEIDIDGNYRYLLGRKWDEKLPQVTFVMLNPSTADHQQDDRTLTKCINLAKSWDYGSLEVVNLFAYRATKRPDLLLTTDDIVGSKNNIHIQSATKRAESVIVAWGGGKFPKIMNRNEKVLSLISDYTLYCLVNNRDDDRTRDGHPFHPLQRARPIKGRKLFI